MTVSVVLGPLPQGTIMEIENRESNVSEVSSGDPVADSFVSYTCAIQPVLVRTRGSLTT
jgi:hypothetical protein